MTFKERLAEVLSQGVETSKDVVGKAKGKAKELGEIGMLRLDVRQLESRAAALIGKLGTLTYEILEEKGQQSVSKGTVGLKEIFAEISDLKEQIEQKEAELRKF